MAGKAFHWYRPLIWDSSNPRKEVWGELNVDAEKGIRTVTIPQEFLDGAVYPVTIDDEFGYTTTPETYHSQTAANYICAHGVYTGAAGTAVSMSICGSNSGDNCQLALYKDSDKSKVAVCSGEVTFTDARSWKTLNFPGSPSVEAIDYWLCWNQNASESIFFDDGAHSLKYDEDTYGDWSTPLSLEDWKADRDYGIYCTYTPGIAPPAAGMPWNLAPKVAMMISSH